MLKLHYILFCAFSSVVICTNGQQVAKTVASHLGSAVRETKVKLGIPVEVKGHTGYTTDSGTQGVNLTFVLSGRDLGTGLDLYAKIAFKSRDSSDVTTFGITESGTGSDTPDWNQVFWFIWKKGTEQKWHIRVYDHASRGTEIGDGILDVDNYIENGEESTVQLSGSTGKVLVRKTTPIKFKLSAKHLSRLDEFNSKSDPYVKVYFRRSEHGANNKFYTTAVIDNVENADWDEVIEFSNYQKGLGQFLFFKVRDSDTITQDDHLGEVLIDADKYVGLKAPHTILLENSGENSSLTVTPVE